MQHQRNKKEGRAKPSCVTVVPSEQRKENHTVPLRTMLFFMLQHWAMSLHFSKGFMDPFIVNYKPCMKVSCCVFE